MDPSGVGHTATTTIAQGNTERTESSMAKKARKKKARKKSSANHGKRPNS
jgi:hypothetical protein